MLLRGHKRPPCWNRKPQKNHNFVVQVNIDYNTDEFSSYGASKEENTYGSDHYPVKQHLEIK